MDDFARSSLPQDLARASAADRRFLTQFRDCSLPEAEWTHRAHVRLAFLYLVAWPLERSVRELRSGIQRYNASLGKAPDLYHETITVAMATLVHGRLGRGELSDFECFQADHADLFSWNPPVLFRYYSRRRLLSKQARLEFLVPDLEPLA